jgi:hypothetical protein
MKKPTVIRDECGSMRGYRKHAAAKEATCEPCKDANSARFRAWYLTAAENEKARFKKNRLDPEYRAKRDEYGRKRRASKKGNETSPYTLEQVFEKWGRDCYICTLSIDYDAPRSPGAEGWERSLHLDHVIPIVYGGADSLDNVKPSHGKCNLLKSAKGPGWVNIETPL